MDRRACAIVEKGNHTDIVLITYSDRILLIVTQFKKLGTFLMVEREYSLEDRFQYRRDDSVLTKIHFGSDTDDVHIAGSYIGQHIELNKPLLLSIALKEYSVTTLHRIVDVIRKIKPW